MRELDLDYISYGQQVGYGIASVNYLKGLSGRVRTLRWKTIIQAEKVEYGFDQDFFEDVPEYLRILMQPRDVEAITTQQIIHTTPEHFRQLVKPRLQNIGMTVWETDRVPVNWLNYFQGLDKLIVPCSWNVEIFERARLGLPIYRLPHISQFHGEEYSLNLLGVDESTFVFLTVSVWERRKNLDVLVDAYLKAFNYKEDVVLVVKTSKRDVSAPYYYIGKKKKYIKTKNKVSIIRLKNGLRTAKVIVIPHHLSSTEMRSLYTRANAYVSMCHAEGWGMGQFESAWFGKPVITPNYSGYLDFLSKERGYLIDSKMVDVVPNEWDINDLKGHQWAEPDKDHAIALMREVYESYEEAKMRGSQLRDFVAQNFSDEKIDEEFIKILRS